MNPHFFTRPQSFVPSLASALFVAVAASASAQTVFTKPAGYVKLHATAASSSSEPSFNFVNHALAQKRKSLGEITAGGTDTLTSGGSSWTADQFAGSEGPHFALITSGAMEGQIYDIESNTTDTLTLVMDSGDTSGLVGDSFRIYQHNTLGSVFGTEDPTADGFLSGDSSDDASQILFYEAESQSFSVYFFNTNEGDVFTSFHVGWVSQGSPTVPAEDTIIPPNQGFIILSRNTAAFEIPVFGDVIDEDVTVPILAEGYNLITVPYPVATGFTLATSGLYDADNFDPQVHLRPGGNTEEADQVVLRIDNSYQIFFVNDDEGDIFSSRHLGWISQNSPDVDASSTIIPQGAFFIFRRDDGVPIDWTFPSAVSESSN